MQFVTHLQLHPSYASATEPLNNPPRYLYTLARPPKPVIYTFTQWSSNSDLTSFAAGSMFLLPPPVPGNHGQSEPLYSISAHLELNPFLPVSHVTEVHRAGPDGGELVGRFE